MSAEISGTALTARQDFLFALIGEAGALAMRYFRHPSLLAVESKGVQDFVTAADKAVEAMLVERIRAAFPTDGIIGEEGGTRDGSSGNAAVWIIDPIDGTANFARGLPFWCISVGVMAGGRVEIGAVLDPVTGELFTARRGAGVFCDGQPIGVSSVADPAQARINLGFTFKRKAKGFLTAVERLTSQNCDWNRLGSAALGLAYVAAGRLDGYWAPHVKAWDVAAGLCLAEEAGAVVNDFMADGGLENGNSVLAAAPGMAAFFQTQLQGLAE